MKVAMPTGFKGKKARSADGARRCNVAVFVTEKRNLPKPLYGYVPRRTFVLWPPEMTSRMATIIIWKEVEVPHIPRIAIVDDDEAVRASTANLLRSLGFGADPFASGEELLGSHRIDDTCCVITDVQMPGMTGLELQRLLLARRRTMPIIFITAYPDERTRRDALAAGAVGFFSKPFDGAALIDCIENALNGSREGKSTPPHRSSRT